MKRILDEQELQTRIFLNYQRLANSPYYQIGDIFATGEQDWPADKEGRALLAFVSHYKISGNKIPCMEQMLQEMPGRLNEKQYFGPVTPNLVSEQQLSGHSWLLRGLCEHYEQFNDEYSLELLKAIIENLFLPTKGIYHTYPVDRVENDEGGVGGTETEVCGHWILSTDIGCAFMSIDGLAHAYQVLLDERIRELADEMIQVYLNIDKKGLRVQTHCTLTAARGMMRLYHLTQSDFYLEGAKNIYDLYVNSGGMTWTYHNLNWWRRPNTWSEPCAIVDSLMLALELFKVTGEEAYRRLAARVYQNAFATMQRANGGAGTDTLVCEGSPWTYLQSDMYEAYFCCTMRLAEGLWYITANKDLLWIETNGQITEKQLPLFGKRMYTDGDVIYAEVSGGAEEYADSFFEIDGHRLCPIVKYYQVPKDVMENSRQQICFD